MNKVELILKEIERLMHAYNLEADIASAEDKDDENIAIAKYNVCANLREFINSLPEEHETELKGWLVRDKDNYTAIYGVKPERGRTEWFDSVHPKNAEESSLLITINDATLIPDLEYEDEPIEVELTIRKV